MTKKASEQSHRLQVTIDTTTKEILDRMSELGIHGRNTPSVANWIITNWIWDSSERLSKFNIDIAEIRKSSSSS